MKKNFQKSSMAVFLLCFSGFLFWKLYPLKDQFLGTPTNRYHLVPILCFHNVDGSGPYSLSRHEFRYYLEAIKKSKVQIIPLKTLLNYAKNKKLLDKPSMVITIDDDYKNITRVAAPLLREYKYPATFFIYTNAVSRDAREGTSWDDLNRLHKEGFEIQNHSHTHTAFHVRRSNETMNAWSRRVHTEIIQSKNILERNIAGLEIYAFAYPMGYRSPYIQQELIRNGYALSLSTDASPVNLSSDFKHIFHRYTIQKKYVQNPEKMFRLQLQYAQKIYSDNDDSSLSHTQK